jgi:ferredoxin
MEHGKYATGDYYLVGQKSGKEMRCRITSNEESSITIDSGDTLNLINNDEIKIRVCLNQPNVDREKCIGCGICVHECPVGGVRAIRVTSDNESRSMKKVT